MPRRLKISASSLISAMLTSRCVFSMTLAASATRMLDAWCVPAVMIDAVQLVDEIGDLGRRARRDLPDRGEAVLLVAGIDALGAVAGEEVLVERQARLALEDRHADLLRAARVHGRLVDHDRRRACSTLPTVSLARISGVRSGRLYSSIGVGTVTMNTRQRFRSASSVVKPSCRALLSSSRVTSSVVSLPGAQLADALGLDVEADASRSACRTRPRAAGPRTRDPPRRCGNCAASACRAKSSGARALHRRRRARRASVAGHRHRPPLTRAMSASSPSWARTSSALAAGTGSMSPVRTSSRTGRAPSGPRGASASASASAPCPPVMAR